jgi:hypothetical protein
LPPKKFRQFSLETPEDERGYFRDAEVAAGVDVMIWMASECGFPLAASSGYNRKAPFYGVSSISDDTERILPVRARCASTEGQ